MNAPEKMRQHDRAMKEHDRTAENVGNIVHLEHFNVVHDDQRLATLFYVVGLGGTRDPYLFVGLDNMWANFGRTQAHLPSRGKTPKPEVLRGTVGLVVPSLSELKQRLERISSDLSSTKFSWKETEGAIDTTCPWGNRIRCHAPSPQFGPSDLGITYVEFDVPQGTAEGIARFYDEVIGAAARAEKLDEKRGRATVSVGRHQKLIFTETGQALPEYDGHHIQVYIADFSTPYLWLKERGLINMETDAHEWRFQWIVDPRDGRKLFQIEHEVRSMKHPLFGRPLVNRNTGITNMTYVPGHDSFRGTY